MDKKLSRIASFIESLPVDESMEACQSVVLSTEMSYLGGAPGDNGEHCENSKYESCFGSKNKKVCINYGDACPGTDNARTCSSGKNKNCVITINPGDSNDGPIN